MVKADAYGIGIEPAVPALAAAGCKTFFVAHLAEAEVRARASRPTPTIYVLNGLLPGACAPCLRAHGLRPGARLAGGDRGMGGASAARDGHDAGAALHVDTGMNRLGLSAGEVRLGALKDSASTISRPR